MILLNTKRQFESIESYGLSFDKRFSDALLGGLPKPVQRYFIHVLMGGQKRLQCVRPEQAGEFRLKPGGGPWAPFEARQTVTTERPGFAWVAKIKANPLLTIRVTDTYFRRQATLSARLFSRFRIAHEHGKPELDLGALMRYLAESVWYPTALFPSRRISWREVDPDRAAVTLRDGKSTVSGIFVFNHRDEIVEFITNDRYRRVKGGYKKERFVAKFDDYREFEGIKIPTKAKAAWGSVANRFEFIKLRISGVRFRS
jgi:hypothetical protein